MDLRNCGQRITNAHHARLVLGNNLAVGSVNANRTHFERGVRDKALAEAQYPVWPEWLLTQPVRVAAGAFRYEMPE